MHPNPRESARAWRVPFLLAVLALSPVTVRAQAGYVHELVGDATVRSGRGAAVAVKAGGTFVAGATFETSQSGRLVLRFEDGQLVALQSNTRFRVDRYRYDPRNPRSSHSAVALVNGAARFVTGVIGATDQEALGLAAGSLRVHRVTDVTLLVDPEGTPGQTVAVNAGVAYVQTVPGAVSDSYTPYATMSVLVGTGQFTSVHTGRPPLLAGPVASAPAAVQAAVNSLNATPLPVNRPVVVGTAARAAAAADHARAVVAAAAADPTNARLRTAAEAAQSTAQAAMTTARNQAALAYDGAIEVGYTIPQLPASSERVQAVAAPVLPEPALRFLGCTGSPC